MRAQQKHMRHDHPFPFSFATCGTRDAPAKSVRVRSPFDRCGSAPRPSAALAFLSSVRTSAFLLHRCRRSRPRRVASRPRAYRPNYHHQPATAEAIARPNLLQLLSLWPKVKTSGVGMGNDRIAQRIRNVINNAQRVPAPLTLHRRRQTQKLHLGSGERVRLGIRPDV